jgi:hypothetical protein
MATTYEAGAGQSGATFDVANWFADWTDHGGIALAGADRLYLARMRGIDRRASARLDELRDQILHAHAWPSLAGLLEARAMAEEA